MKSAPKMPFADMTPHQIEAFLNERRQAIVGLGQVDGPPILSPVWYRYDGVRINFAVLASSLKFRRLSRDPRVTLLIDGEYTDMRNITIYGRAEFWRATRFLVLISK